MFSRFFGSRASSKESEFEIEEDTKNDDDDDDDNWTNSLKVNLSRLIAYATSADVTLQREVAEKLANEAVNPKRQVQIVEYGGLKLLVPLTKSVDVEVQRLVAHALANLSVNANNQQLMADEGAIEMLIPLLSINHELVQRQSAKALANLAVNASNKRKIALAGGITKLINLVISHHIPVRIEAVAALANLAVNDLNETDIVQAGGVEPIIASLTISMNSLRFSGDCKDDFNSTDGLYEELAAQCTRAVRNLSVNPLNKQLLIRLGTTEILHTLKNWPSDRISQQARKALRNLA